ncbi:MAG: DUF3078 domain-containing protein [Alistipes sp.]
MKYFYLTILMTVASCATAVAQISVDEVEAKKEDAAFANPIKIAQMTPDFFSPAKYRAERAAIRKERNFLEYGAGLQGTLTSYSDSWIKTSGGDNSIAMIFSAFLHHTFKKNLFFIETKFGAKIGYNRMKVETVSEDGTASSDGVWFKNQDEFFISTAPSFKMSKNWSYGSIIKFRSQFVNGYKSRTEQKETHRKSTFMAPGYFDISLGMNYTSPKPKWPFVVNLSPLALSGTFVENSIIRQNGFLYGIEDPDNTSKWEGGSSIQIDYDRTFGRQGVIRYRTTLFAFYGWITNIGQKNKYTDYTEFRQAFDKWSSVQKPNIKEKPRLSIHPTVRWENTIDIKATKYLSTTLSFQLYYNRAQNLDVQTQTLLSVGLIYTFKNK